MAPFGKNFLKARMKSRTKDGEPVVGKEIQVTVCSEEKVVCGVTKHTTCADVIQALLEDHRSIPESRRLLHGDPGDFCLVERWKGFERALPPLTRILRLWYAWGDQRPFIQFFLVKTSDFVPQATKKAGKSKGAKPKRWDHGRSQCGQQLPAEKQKRMVKRAFRKLEKLHQENRSFPGVEEVDRMVQLILNQDHMIREQIHRMRDLDLKIEQFEVQMSEDAEPASPASGPAADGAEQLEELLYSGAGVEQLQLQVQRHQELILQLSLDIDAELRRAQLPLVPDQDRVQDGAEADEELRRLGDELKRSVFSGVALHNQAAELQKQLQHLDGALALKDQECWQLASQLDSLQVTEGSEEPRPGAVPPTVRLKQSPLDATDTDSDTGISSTHSQDSLSPCLDFPPPLDTDV